MRDIPALQEQRSYCLPKSPCIAWSLSRGLYFRLAPATVLVEQTGDHRGLEQKHRGYCQDLPAILVPCRQITEAISVIRFNEQGPDGLINIPSPGAPAKLDETHKAFLARIVEDGPIPAIHGVVRWRACDLIMQLHEEFALSVSDDTIYRALKDLGFSHVSARPKAYKQDTEAMDAFKKTSPDAWRKRARSSHPAHR
jgi:transposase